MAKAYLISWNMDSMGDNVRDIVDVSGNIVCRHNTPQAYIYNLTYSSFDAPMNPGVDFPMEIISKNREVDVSDKEVTLEFLP